MCRDIYIENIDNGVCKILLREHGKKNHIQSILSLRNDHSVVLEMVTMLVLLTVALTHQLLPLFALHSPS